MKALITGVTGQDGSDLFEVTGLLFNHESPRRGKEFVTRKVTDAVLFRATDRSPVLDVRCLRACTGWAPRHTFRDTLADALSAARRENPL